jgi:predicted kinase
MKPLNLKKPLIIMMVGLPGSGKSFFARQFAETFRAPLISYDMLKYYLQSDSDYHKEKEKLLTLFVTSQLSQITKTQKTIVIDGGMNARSNRAEVEKIAKLHDYDTLVIWAQTDLPTAKKRCVSRGQNKTASLRSQSNEEFSRQLDPAIFEKYCKLLDTPSSRESQIVISGKHTYSTQAHIVLRWLVERQNDDLGSGPSGQAKTERATQVTTGAARSTSRPTQNRRNISVN